MVGVTTDALHADGRGCIFCAVMNIGHERRGKQHVLRQINKSVHLHNGMASATGMKLHASLAERTSNCTLNALQLGNKINSTLIATDDNFRTLNNLRMGCFPGLHLLREVAGSSGSRNTRGGFRRVILN